MLKKDIIFKVFDCVRIMRLNGIAIKISRKSDLESITESFNNILQNPVFQTDDKLREFREYLDNNYQNHIFLSNNVNIPRNFKEKIGVYPFEFLQIYRISKAIELMKKTNLVVSEVAFNVGYQNLRTFESGFKAYTGINPLEYKKQVLPKRTESEVSSTENSENDSFPDPRKGLEDIISYYPTIKRAIEYMEKNFSEDISHRDIAKAANMGREPLSNYFHKMTGIKLIREYLNIVRIKEAMKLINQGNKKITDIAFDVGYQDLGTFERNFKKYVKITPHAYKKSLKKN